MNDPPFVVFLCLDFYFFIKAKRDLSLRWSVPPLLRFYYIELTVYNSLFSFVSRVLFSFVDFIIQKEPLFVKTLFVIFNYFLSFYKLCIFIVIVYILYNIYLLYLGIYL